MKEVPLPPPVEPVKERPPRRVRKVLAASLVLAAAATSAGFWWQSTHGFGPAHPIEAVLREAAAAYEQGQLSVAEAKYRQAAAMEVPDRLRYDRDQAGLTLMLVEAERRLEADDSDGAEAKIRAARLRGANQAWIDAISRKLWSKRDAHRLAEAGSRDVDRGDYASAELRADEYAAQARATGLDPNELRDRLELSRKEKKYTGAIQQANEAIAKTDFDAALLACADAENVKVTSETRLLHKRILELRERATWMVRGDDALVKRDFAAAAAAYEKANQLETTPEMEAKVRFAGACVLYEEALTAIADGDLIGAEQRLRSSLWKYPIEEVRAKLTKMAPAFEAARLVRKADLAAARKDYAEAERQYTEALPNLPEPAKGSAEQKLVRLKQAATQPDGNGAGPSRN